MEEIKECSYCHHVHEGKLCAEPKAMLIMFFIGIALLLVMLIFCK